jgi:hypothetical protein
MILAVLRGTCRITAAGTGVTLIYGIGFALSGMTTRIPSTPFHELITTTLYMIPWALLLCSGAEDLAKIAGQTAVFWIWLTTGLAFLYYLEHFTGDRAVTRIAMPLLAFTAGSLPHFVRRVGFVFTLTSLAAGLAGLAVLYLLLRTFLSSGVVSFSTRTIGVLVMTFITTSLVTAVLSMTFLQVRRHAG